MSGSGQSAGGVGGSSPSLHPLGRHWKARQCTAHTLTKATLSQRPHSHKSHTLTLCPIVLGLRRNRIRQRSRSRRRKSNPVRPSQPATQKFHFSHTERALASHHPLSAFCNNHGAQSRQRTAPSPPKPSHDKAGVSHVCGTGCSRRLSSHLVISPAVLAM